MVFFIVNLWQNSSLFACVHYYIMFGRIGIGQIVLIVLVILLLFGGKKIPELMRGLGKGVRSFKDGLNGEGDDEAAHKEDSAKKEDTKE